MNARIITATAIVFVGGMLASSAVARHARTTSCATHEGTVSGYTPAAARTCGVVTNLAPLFRTETLHTGSSPSQFTFHTLHLHLCRESASTADVLLPSSSVAILHLRGKTWCRHNSDTDPKTYLSTKAPNNVIRTTGTIIGLTFSDQGLLIQLADGAASVTSRVTNRTVGVKAGSQLLVPFTGSPGKPTPLVLTLEDQIAVAELRSDVIEMGAPQTRPHLLGLHEKSAVLVTDTAQSARQMQAQLRGVNVISLTTDQVTANPTIVAADLKQLSTQTVITAGAFSAVGALWPVLRTQAELPANTDVVYVQL